LPAAEGPVYHEQPARATGNDQFGWCPQANDWYETVKINYGIDYCDAGGRSEHFSPIPDTWGKMTDILLFWAAKGVDAFRCDMAEMVPAAFWHWATDKVKFAYQNVRFIGEVYDPRQYRNYIAAGFDYLYDKVGMYDCLREVICGRRRAADITQQWQVNDDILSHMLYFLENHDKQRVASDFFAADARKGIPGMMVCAWLNSSPVMVYAGQEFGERGMDAEGFSGLDGRTTIFDYWTVDTLRRGFFDRRRLKKTEKSLLDSYSTILSLANQEEALREGAFYDLMYVNPQMAERQFAFMRKKDNQLMLIVVNFDEKAADCQVNIPEHVFEWWQLSEGHFPATDLLTGEKSIVALSPNHPVGVTVPALGGCVIRIKD
jgi:glycosidase